MKNTFLKFAMVVGLFTFLPDFTVSAQTTTASWYWVVESNTRQKKTSIVRFYNKEHQLVYEEKVTGRKLDIRKPKNKKLLDNALQQIMVTPPTYAILGSKKF
ncbi:hypothetical protein [Rufibacter tibetensis]|uniref:Uncharacterized protein n=1 Tax=Rufibacter tibetensis TaxID=512763 RepID=A0A0P0C3S7_9BACT|nr:hypothetical protein [Rufibacter tibetensis]ALI97697.1 hypothetical protein DC20_00190 [Rufibacter tibetensis]